MPQESAKTSIVVNDLDAGEYGHIPWCAAHHPTFHRELARLQEFLSGQRAQKRKRPEEGGASEAGALPDNGGINERDDTGNGNDNDRRRSC